METVASLSDLANQWETNAHHILDRLGVPEEDTDQRDDWYASADEEEILDYREAHTLLQCVKELRDHLSQE